MTDFKDSRSFLEFIIEKLNRRIRELDKSILETDLDIDRMHEYYWENYTEMDEYGYENYDNQQALFRQMQFREDDAHLRRRFARMMDNPFFGRVDFLFEGDEVPEIFYIGIANFSENAGDVPLIYDWRAPISSLFYDYEKGPASYEAPLGTITGEITSRRQYKIRNGRMIYEVESDIKIDDEVLMRELGEAGQTKLKNIVQTIQREQNAIIRNTTDRIMVIQGSAGSGKTSIALHRIAYLLYHDRKHLNSSNILILSPNGIFADYISQILPELGEENIREMTFDIYAYRQLQESVYDCEERYDLLEQEIRGELSGRGDKGISELCEFKQSREMSDLLEEFTLILEDDLMNFHDVVYRGYLIPEKQIVDLFYNRFPDAPLLSRMNDIAEYFIDAIETLFQKEIPDEDKEYLMTEFLSMYETTDLYKLYNRFLEFAGFPQLPDVPKEKRILKYEDVYPMLYLKNSLLKRSPDPSIKHLVVDEMQDYSWLQYAVLCQMFNCRMTILGDKAQTLDGSQNDVLTFLPGILGKNIRMISINKCYRNTVEIAEYANSLYGITDIDLIERHGKPVEILSYSETGEALDYIAEIVSASSAETMAVITLTEEMAEDYARQLRPSLVKRGYNAQDRLSLLNRESRSFKKGLTVTTFYLSKGLEFEQVFLLMPKVEKDDPSSLITRAKYIGATRAMHELYVLSV